MADVRIRFRAVLGPEDLACWNGFTGYPVDVEVQVELCIVTWQPHEPSTIVLGCWRSVPCRSETAADERECQVAGFARDNFHR